MRSRLLILLLFTSLTCCAQTDKYVGEYIKKSSGIKQLYKLTLNSNGTLEFEQHWAQVGMSNETQDTGIEKGKGLWTFENKLIMLSCNNETDITQDYRLDFDDTEVRILNDSIVRFVKSKLFWVENMELKKKM